MTSIYLSRLLVASMGSIALTIGASSYEASGHTLEDLKKEVGEVAEPLERITKAYERALREPVDKEHGNLEPYQQSAMKAHGDALRAQLHAVQHQMLDDHRKAQHKMECVELLTKIPAAERRAQKLQKAGKSEEAERVQSWIDEAKALATVNCSPVTLMP